MILLNFVIEYKLDNVILNIISKQDILYWLNIINFIHFIFYKLIKTILINIYFYLIQFYIIMLYSNMYNKFIKTTLLSYNYFKQIFLMPYTYIMKRIIKKNRFYKNYYKFHHIDYLKILFFIMCFILFCLMWRRRSTYYKSAFLMKLIFFYVASILISCIIVPLFLNTFIGISLSLLIAYLLVFFTLN